MAALLLTMSVSSAFATKMFDQYWKPGEYTVEPTDAEKAYYNSLYETALKKSEGTLIRKNAAVTEYRAICKRVSIVNVAGCEETGRPIRNIPSSRS